MRRDSQHATIIRAMIEAVWNQGNLDALPMFWSANCVNHAMPGPQNVGLAALRAYHEGFLAAFAAFSNIGTSVVQQIEEGDRVVTQMVSKGIHSGDFLGVPATGRGVLLAAIRIDRLDNGKIAEHWSVSDVAGLLEQLQRQDTNV